MAEKVGTSAPPDVGVTNAPDVGAEMKVDAVKQSAPRKKLVTFQMNQKWELTIGGKIVAVFMPGESKVLDDWIPNHPDFAAFKELFVVQEVI